jgi:GGDEF domain-containing protein
VRELDRLAHHDALVPLPNRRGFERNLSALIDRVTRYGDSGALLFIDVDGLRWSTTASVTMPAMRR